MTQAQFILALNSRGQLVQNGKVTVLDVMNAAKKSITAYPNTTEADPGRKVNGFTEREYQAALTALLGAVNGKDHLSLPS